ncbi:MAG: hypothetical protein IKZ88_01055 [Neisseriaceae bacterium]|nr:hypothetical protein [Neisseriaceae bacterium]
MSDTQMFSGSLKNQNRNAIPNLSNNIAKTISGSLKPPYFNAYAVCVFSCLQRLYSTV